MCGRYTINKNAQTIRVVFNVTIPANLRLVPRYNVAPSQLVPVITNASPELQMFRWGLIPFWAKDQKVGDKMINARAETLAEKPTFRTALLRRRCLFPADGFYEWRLQPDGESKTPLYITLPNAELFAFAGLWDTWRPPAGPTVHSCTIITTAANKFMQPFHDRMPVILPPIAYAQWLAPNEPPLDTLLRAYPDHEMSLRPVTPLVNSPKNEGPELIAATP